MRLWTIQPKSMYDVLRKDKVLHCDHTNSSCSINDTDPQVQKSFKMGYDFIVSQMKARIGNPPDGVQYPIWLWHMDQPGINARPDLRKHNRYSPRPYVMMELEIPSDQVLLSNFELYHMILNDSPIYDDYNSDEEYNAMDEWYESLPSESKAKYKLESWSKIFNINFTQDITQATVWEIKLDYLVRVWHYVKKDII